MGFVDIDKIKNAQYHLICLSQKSSDLKGEVSNDK